MKPEEYDIKIKTKIQREVLNLRMAEKGSIWMEADGFSMYPIIRKGDRLKIKPVSFRELKVGNIVATKGKRQVDTVTAHRLIRKSENPDLLLTKGDGNNLKSCDTPIETEYLIGKVVTIEHGRDIIKIDNFLWNLFGYITVKLFLFIPRLAKIFLLAISLFFMPRQIFPKISQAITKKTKLTNEEDL